MKQPSLSNNISYQYYDLPVAFPCQAFSDIDQLPDNNSSCKKHFHNCIELGYCKSGNGTLFIENSEFSFRAGNYSFIPENTAHLLRNADNNCSWAYVYFDPYLMFKDIFPDAILEQLLSALPACSSLISEDSDKELHFLMERIFSEASQKESYYQDSLKGLFLSLLTLIARHKRNQPLPHSDFQWLYSAINYIHKNYQQKLTIAEIAEVCCELSESHFRKKFHQIMHVSPLDYINHLRIRIACQLIYNNEKPLNEIASDVGFPTLSSFNRNFQAYYHCSPSSWRKMN